jgi:hypothetical protein
MVTFVCSIPNLLVVELGVVMENIASTKTTSCIEGGGEGGWSYDLSFFWLCIWFPLKICRKWLCRERMNDELDSGLVFGCSSLHSIYHLDTKNVDLRKVEINIIYLW